MATGDISALYAGATATALTITLASLANAAARASTAVDNTSTLYDDALVVVKAKLATGSPASDKIINVYAYGGSEATTPIYPDKVTGSDAAITLDSPTNLRFMGSIQAATSGALTYDGGPWSVITALGLWVLPQKWGIVIENRTNLALDSTGGNHAVVFQGLKMNVA